VWSKNKRLFFFSLYPDRLSMSDDLLLSKFHTQFEEVKRATRAQTARPLTAEDIAWQQLVDAQAKEHARMAAARPTAEQKQQQRHKYLQAQATLARDRGLCITDERFVVLVFIPFAQHTTRKGEHAYDMPHMHVTVCPDQPPMNRDELTNVAREYLMTEQGKTLVQANRYSIDHSPTAITLMHTSGDGSDKTPVARIYMQHTTVNTSDLALSGRVLFAHVHFLTSAWRHDLETHGRRLDWSTSYHMDATPNLFHVSTHRHTLEHQILHTLQDHHPGAIHRKPLMGSTCYEYILPDEQHRVMAIGQMHGCVVPYSPLSVEDVTQRRIHNPHVPLFTSTRQKKVK
jgi:hypothetical protein